MVRRASSSTPRADGDAIWSLEAPEDARLPHSWRSDDGGRDAGGRRPAACLDAWPRLTPGRRLWGAAAQLYSACEVASRERVRRLRRLGRASPGRLGRRGADALAISPVHALVRRRSVPFRPLRALRHACSLNVLFADPSERWVADAPQAAALATRLIDWPEAAGASKLVRACGRCSNAFGAAAAASRRPRRICRRFRAMPAERTWSGTRGTRRCTPASTNRDGRDGAGSDWPARRSMIPPAWSVGRLRRRVHAPEVDFHVFLQWLADLGLARGAERRSQGGGHGGGPDRRCGGGHGRRRKPRLEPACRTCCSGLSRRCAARPVPTRKVRTGASPPSLAGRRCGAAAIDAFLSTLRAAMRHAGGVRIDHAMGLRRLWLTPARRRRRGMAPTSQYPFEDMLRLIALESCARPSDRRGRGPRHSARTAFARRPRRWA